MSPFGGMGGFVFDIIPFIVMIGFFVVLGLIVFRAMQGAKQWSRNNQSPILTVYATVIAKRTNVSQHQQMTGNPDNNIPYMTSDTSYYATFEVESGDRMEFMIKGREYGLLMDQDKGKLTFQGTRYLGFERL